MSPMIEHNGGGWTVVATPGLVAGASVVAGGRGATVWRWLWA
jgi:hypothetical protein